MSKFGEEERKRVIEFVEEEEGVSLTAVRRGRKFFRDEAQRQWWILGGVPGKKAQCWHAIPMEAFEADWGEAPGLSALKNLPRDESINLLKSKGLSKEESTTIIEILQRPNEILARDVEGTLVISVWDGQIIHVFQGPLKHLFRQKNSLSKSGQGAYHFNSEIRSESLAVYGNNGLRLFSLSKMGIMPYRE